MLTIAGYSKQHGPLNNAFGYVHIYDDEADTEVVHTFDLIGHVNDAVLLSAYNEGKTAFHSTIEKDQR